MIENDQGYVWASCDKCTFTLGVGFDAGKPEVMSAMDAWGWKIVDGKMICNFCQEEERSAS